MQEKLQKISPIKQNILQFIDYLNISKRDFYAKTGISRGTLESSTGITEETMAKFIATHPDISLEWLLTGQGSMFKSETKVEKQKEEIETNAKDINDAYKDKYIEQLEGENRRLTELVDYFMESNKKESHVQESGMCG